MKIHFTVSPDMVQLALHRLRNAFASVQAHGDPTPDTDDPGLVHVDVTVTF